MTDKKYLVSFIGCVPAEDPQAVVYVIIDEPNVEDQAHSTYATEYASKIMKKILPFLGIYSDAEETPAPSAEEGQPAGNDPAAEDGKPEEGTPTEEE